MATKRKSEFADYDRPPVTEVAYGARFSPLKGWMLPHIGAFWLQIFKEFPRVEHAAPIQPDIVDPAVGLPVPRVWLISEADDRLVQLQTGRFLLNWRRTKNVEPYPRYGILSAKFFSLFKQYQDFLAEMSIGPMEIMEYELTYINHVVEQEAWKFPQHLGRVIDELGWSRSKKGFLPEPVVTNWQAQFPFRDMPGHLIVRVRPARHAEDGRNAISLELSARGSPDKEPLNRCEEWFSHAHEWIVRGFEDLTSEEAQRDLWGKDE